MRSDPRRNPAQEFLGSPASFASVNPQFWFKILFQSVLYIVLTKKIRVRKHTFELLVELVYRLELNLLGKKSEFGDLKPDTRSAISHLLSASRAAKTSIEKNCLLNPDFTTRSKELNAVLGAIEMLKDAEVLSINGVK